MIKLIASDLDGTILRNGAQSVDASMIETVKLLLAQGIIFAPASGRQMTSLMRLFAPVAADLLYIAENGALVKYKNEVLVKTPIERRLAMKIIRDIVAVPNCEALVSGEETAYIQPKTPEYYRRMTEVVNYHTTVVTDFNDIPEEIIKISVCDLSGISNSAGYFQQKWKDQAAIAVSGSQYLDFTESSVSKGSAMRKIQHKLHLTPDECMAFGDNFNDLAMLDSVTHSYVMDSAADAVKQHGRFVTDWVEQTLRRQFL